MKDLTLKVVTQIFGWFKFRVYRISWKWGWFSVNVTETLFHWKIGELRHISGFDFFFDVINFYSYVLVEDINNNDLGIHFHEVIICLQLFGANFPVLLKTFLFLHTFKFLICSLFILKSINSSFSSLLNPLFWWSSIIYFYKIYFNSSSSWPIYERRMVIFHDLKLNRKSDML